MYKVSFRPYVETDYDYVRNCDEAGCDSICRCGRIENLTIKSVSLSVDSVSVEESYKTKSGATRYRWYKLDKIESYCVDRLLRIFRAFDVSKYEAHVTRGYYGEEVDGSTFSEADSLIQSIEEMLSLTSDLEKVKFVLNKEYLMLLPEIREATIVTVEKVKLDEIVAFNQDYMYRLKRYASEYEFTEGVPVGVLYRQKDGSLRLIDGYHRYCSLLADQILEKKKKSIECVIFGW
jgi:hypothetical protein